MIAGVNARPVARRRALARALLASALLAALAVPLGAAAEEPAPTVRARADTTATSVGGRVDLTLDVDTPAGWFVTPPERSAELGSFRVRALSDAERTDTHRTIVLTLVATEAGEVEIPPIKVTATHGSDPDKLELATEPIPITVASNLAPEEVAAAPPAPGPGMGPPAASGPDAGEPEGPQPADLKPALEAPRRWTPVIIAAAALLLAALIAWRVARWLSARNPEALEAARVPQVPERPAWDVALEELDAIREARYVERGVPARQYQEVTDTLRRYLENRYGLRALECTTSDLREPLRTAPIPGDLPARILSLLTEADLVKFAKGIPDPAGAAATEGRVRHIVQETMPPPAQEEAA